MDMLNNLYYSFISKDKLDDKLFEAVLHRNTKDVEFWLKNGADVNMRICAPINIAAQMSDIETTALLIQYGADVNGYGCTGETPLIEAVNANHINIVSLLLEHNADINKLGRRYMSALEHSANKLNLNMIDLLIKKGTNIDLLPIALETAFLAGNGTHQPEAAFCILFAMTPEQRNTFANSKPTHNKLVIRFDELRTNANKLFDIAMFAISTDPNTLSSCQSNFEIVLWNKLINTSITAQNFPDWYQPYINQHLATALNVLKNVYQKINQTMPIIFTQASPSINHVFFSGMTFSFNQERNNNLPKMEIDGTDEPKERSLKRENQDNQHENGPNKKKVKHEHATGFVSSMAYYFNQAKDYFITPEMEIENSSIKREHEDSQHQQGPDKKRKKI